MKRKKSSMQALEITKLDDKKVAIEFEDAKARIRGTAILLFLKEGFSLSLGKGKYIVSDYVRDYLKDKGIAFHEISLPPRFRKLATNR